MVFASDATVQKQHSEKLPNEVLGVLRLFDGRRAMVDVLQDSPYRMFETLRVARKAVDAGLLKAVPPVAPTIPGATANARGARYVASSENDVDTWLWSAEWTGGPVVATASAATSSPSSTATTINGSNNSKKNKKKKGGGNTTKGVGVVVEQATTAPAKPAGIEWGELIPRSTAAELDGLSGVVPASQTSGEIVAGRPGRSSSSAYAALTDAPATRKAPREALESLTDAETRERMFSVIVGDVDPAASATTTRPKISDEPPVMMSGELGGAEGRAARKSQSLAVPVNESAPSGGVVGEISSSVARSVEVTPVGSTSPSVLVNDLAAIHTAAANAVAGTAETPPQGVPVIRDEETRRESQQVAHPSARNARSTEAETMIGSISTGAASLGASVTSSSIAEAVAHAMAAPTSVLGNVPPSEPSIVIAAPRNARSTAAEEMVSQTRHSVVAAAVAATHAFSDEEEAFFRKGNETQQAVVHIAPAETFSDLDEDYKPAGLWDRFRGRPNTRR